MKLQDSVVAITGGGQGLGRAMAEYLAARGVRLALIDLAPEKLEEAAAACKEAGSEAKTYVCNVAKEDEVEKTFAAIVEDFGQLNGLVNNAGILRDGLLVKVKDGQIVKRMELSQWQSVIDVNLTGVFLCGREAATHMINSDSKGVIINIASISRAGNVGQSNYSAAKAGISALVPVWAKELARYGIRCMGIAPGFVGTEMTGSMRPEVLEKLIAGIPLKRMGKPEEIASTVAFILENDYLSGRMIEVDGAMRL
ncbi:MAG: SDR family oxidoreductase [Oceanospirillales bacterium]|jgi:3-oxoacyl-[acyl-carrier protein] reductase|uniref:SDR family oxidoreductase n=1 Tax=Marinobacter maritimus TaxID=277961 RepID=UPI000BD9140D|nr:SDR family oxidoreductase [Marinobacter maritimus]MBL1272271.1 SDR family oxidoreductase [Oceanospirillales bacterium]|tara:strand:+ start:270 stop:1031 length:762 start_codon:yes stop_codon:yes gene_type:complete